MMIDLRVILDFVSDDLVIDRVISRRSTVFFFLVIKWIRSAEKCVFCLFLGEFCFKSCSLFFLLYCLVISQLNGRDD